jgi:hypothetical protein
VGGKSFHQNVSYLTVEVGRKEMLFCWNTLSKPGIRVIFFSKLVLEDILGGRGFPDAEPDLGIGDVARNFDIRTEIRDIGTVGLRDVDILYIVVLYRTYVTFNFDGCVEVSILLHRLQIKYTVHALSIFLSLVTPFVLNQVTELC